MTAPPTRPRAAAPSATTVGSTTLPRALGVFSIGLGVAQLVAPRRFSRAVGATGRDERPGVVRVVGAREIAAGVGLLSQRPVPFMWMRVAGDVMDLALLRNAARSRDARHDRVSAAVASVLGITAADVAGAVGGVTGDGALLGAKAVQRSITIGRPPAEVYAFWRRLEQLPLFMRHLESVQELDARRSHWVATGPLDTRVEWDAEIITDEPDRLIAWRSAPGAQVRHEGMVRFLPAPGDRGTEVHVDLTYAPPAGPLGVALAKVTGREPSQQISEDLRRLKQILETGQVIRSEAMAGGRRFRQRPAQPLGERPPAPIEAPARWGGGLPARTSQGGDGQTPASAVSDASRGKQRPMGSTDLDLADAATSTAMGGTR